MSAAFTNWSRLSHVPFRLLTYMALITLDRDDEPRFWGGRDDLAHAIGRTVPRKPDDVDISEQAQTARRQRRAAFEAVRAGLRELKDAGAISTVKHARQGTRAEYLLNLQAQGQPGSVAQAHPGSAVQAHPVEGTGSSCALAQAHPGPEEETGPQGLLGGGDHVGRDHSLAAPSSRVVRSTSDFQDDLGSWGAPVVAVGR